MLAKSQGLDILTQEYQFCSTRPIWFCLPFGAADSWMFLDRDNLFMAPNISFGSQSAQILFGVVDKSTIHCLICVAMDSPSKSFRGYVYFAFVALSTINRQYLTPPIPVDDPYPTSIRIVSPNTSFLFEKNYLLFPYEMLHSALFGTLQSQDLC
mmetsp:Transcript_3327/g.4657  ORF Transcript_3327/g.4657 Transcript_3327/m.4657 type:complete len:154 (+) Transcript_3327:2691-3152(+)